jgi:hypothetical protein
MFDPTTVQALGQIRLAEMHAQARRDALARAARRARRQHTAQSTVLTLAALTRRARRFASAPESP